MKLKRRYLLIFVVLMGIVFVSQVRSLLANYNLVEDMNLTSSILSLEEGEILTVSVTDSNIEDTKLVIPIDENTEYIDSDYQDASVVFDRINQQVVIDWLDPSNENKSVKIRLKLNKEGIYPLKALTVRENQEVGTEEKNIEVNAVKKPKEESVDPEFSKSFEEYSSEESTEMKVDNTYAIKTGLWGTAHYEFNEEAGEIKVQSGELTNDNLSDWQQRGINSKLIKKIIFQESVMAPTNSSHLFSNIGSFNLDEIVGLEYLKTSKVTDMSYMFSNSKVTKIDVSHFDTSKVTDMNDMFYYSRATKIDVSHFDTSKVTDMSRMFGNTMTEHLDISNFDTSNATNMSVMFGYSIATELDVSNFDTSKVTDMNMMFIRTKVSELDLSTFDTSKVTNMNRMFEASSATKIDISHFDTSKVTSMKSMFEASYAKEIDISHFDTSKVMNMNSMFANSSATKIDTSQFDTSKVTDMNRMFMFSETTKIDVSNFDTSKVTDMNSMFRYTKVSELDLSTFDTSKVLDMNGIFDFAFLSKLKLGEKFRVTFDSDTGLGSPIALNLDDKLTGNWKREDSSLGSYSPEEFMRNYGEGDLTSGIYVAETVLPGEVTAKVNISNQTHANDLFYVNDEVIIENTIHHTGDIYNFIYKTIIPEELTISEESFKGNAITEDGYKIDFPVDAFKFDESSQTLEVNLKSIAEPDRKGNYYTAVDVDFYYEINSKVNKDAIGKNIEINTTINYFDNVLNPKPDVNISTESKGIYGLDPQWDLLKEIKNLSRSDELTAVGDDLEFTIKATNSEELGAMSNFELAENSFPKELDFISESAELTLPDGTTKKLPDSVFQSDKEKVSTNVFSGNGYVGVNPYQLRFKAKVKDTAYGKILETKANLKGTTHAGKELTIEDDSVKINVAYSGKLGFKETPKTLSFKDSFISAFTSTIERKDAEWGVSIEDTRVQKQPWNLSVKQLSPFESNDGDQLTQVMIFRKNGIEDKGIDVDNEVDVYSENNSNPNDYFISWGKNEGFFLKVPPGTAKAKQYQTELQWNLKDTPI